MKTTLKNSIDYLNKKTGRNSGFTVPANYFSELEDAIFTQILAGRFPKETGFETPENYFDSLENKILNTVLIEQKQPKVISLQRRVLKIVPYVAAASIALILTFNLLFFNKSTVLSMDSISKGDIENWIETNSFTNNDLVTNLGNEVLDLNDFLFVDFKNAALEDYLSTIDTQDILNEIDY